MTFLYPYNSVNPDYVYCDGKNTILKTPTDKAKRSLLSTWVVQCLVHKQNENEIVSDGSTKGFTDLDGYKGGRPLPQGRRGVGRVVNHSVQCN